jgi:hypothetical protein
MREWRFRMNVISTRQILSWLAVSSIGVIGTADAQGRADCQSPQPPSIGVAVGRSSPYIELNSDAVGAEPVGSVHVRGATQVAGRADLPVTGPLRVRLEGANAHWDVRRTLYDANAGYQVTDESSIGSMSARHVVALVGIRTGRPPVCAHVSAGPGYYSIGFRNASLRRTGFALAAGMELPTGRHGAIQADVTLHLIRIGDEYGNPITNFSAVLTQSLLIGWAYRF